jgi:uncharacterized pyridoxamine 5'-phosphate oxidase family protein
MLLDKADKFVVDASTMGQPKSRPSRQFMKHDEILFYCNSAMITFLCLKENCQDISILSKEETAVI